MNVVEARLALFVERMREKLAHPRNTAKSDWRNMTTDQLLARIEDEVKEIAEALEHMNLHYSDATVDDVVRECADVANFCMMLADLVQP